MQINDDRIFAINFCPDLTIASRDLKEDDIHNEKHYFDYAEDIGYRGHELYSLPYLSYKMMVALPPK